MKRHIASLMSLLVGAGLALAQSGVAPKPLAPDTGAPTAPVTAMPTLGVADRPACSDGSCGSAEGGECRIITAQAEYVLWFLANSHDAVPLATNDFLGQVDTVVLGGIGDAEHAGRNPGSGGRFSLGYWFVEENPWVRSGIRDAGGEATFFFVGQRSADLTIAEPATLVRPFFDVNNRRQSGFPVAAPELAAGEINAHADFEVWGFELNGWKNAYYNWPGTNFAVDVMAGLRYLEANSHVDINSISVFNRTIAAGAPYASFAGDQLQVFDSFAAHNHFYGGQVGVATHTWLLDTFMLDTSFRLALGDNHEELRIAGSQLRTFPGGATTTSNGGLLALPSNIGDHHHDRFAQVAEGDVKLAWPVLDHLTISTGFSAMYWNRVLRAAKQIDRNIDVSQIPNFPLAAGATPTGLGAPGVFFRQSDLWVLGISFGAEVSW